MDKNNFDSKIYCCSNAARTETKTLGLIDVILHTISLILSIWISDLVRNHNEYIQSILLSTNSTYCDYEGLFQQIEQHPDFIIVPLILYSICGMILGALLFHAARTKNQRLLKLWFIITLVTIFLGLYASVMMVIEVKHKIPLGAILIMGYLYAWYELWIVIRLIRELRSGSRSPRILDISNHTESKVDDPDPPAVIVLSPSPTPVYTIENDTLNKRSSKKKEDRDALVSDDDGE